LAAAVVPVDAQAAAVVPVDAQAAEIVMDQDRALIRAPLDPVAATLVPQEILDLHGLMMGVQHFWMTLAQETVLPIHAPLPIHVLRVLPIHVLRVLPIHVLRVLPIHDPLVIRALRVLLDRVLQNLKPVGNEEVLAAIDYESPSSPPFSMESGRFRWNS
jgi:hypothetical protein